MGMPCHEHEQRCDGTVRRACAEEDRLFLDLYIGAFAWRDRDLYCRTFWLSTCLCACMD